MALLKTKELDSGLVIEYFRVESIKMTKCGRTEVKLVGYKSQEAAKVEGKQPAFEQVFMLDEFTPALLDGKNAYALAYEKITESSIEEVVQNDLELTRVTQETNWYADCKFV